MDRPATDSVLEDLGERPGTLGVSSEVKRRVGIHQVGGESFRLEAAQSLALHLGTESSLALLALTARKQRPKRSGQKRKLDRGGSLSADK